MSRRRTRVPQLNWGVSQRYTTRRSGLLRLQFHLGAVLLVAWSLVACRETAPGPDCEGPPVGLPAALHPAAGNSGLTLLVFPERDTVKSAESLAVTVVFRAGRDGARFHYDFEYLDFVVLGPDGGELESNRLYVTTSGSPVALEPYGFWGVPEVLTCAAPRSGLPPDCDWQFRLSKPGVYRIVARFRTSPPPDARAPVAGRDFLDLTSDTARVVYMARATSVRTRPAG